MFGQSGFNVTKNIAGSFFTLTVSVSFVNIVDGATLLFLSAQGALSTVYVIKSVPILLDYVLTTALLNAASVGAAGSVKLWEAFIRA